jgi:hypothetical protein
MMSERTQVTIRTRDGNSHVYTGPDAEDVYRAVLAVLVGDAPFAVIRSRTSTARFEASDLRSVE